MPQIICILGPTATGKTALAIHLAKTLDGEIISVDSALVYKGMDIGTAKPDAMERQGIAHHLIDLIEPEQSYSAAQFCADARLCMDDIVSRGKTPILAGGTMMYFNALLNGLSDLPSANPEVRQKIEQEAAQLGWPAMHARLQKIDPTAAERIKPTDPQRLTRALEVYELMGRNLTELCEKNARNTLPYPTRAFGLLPSERQKLHERIERRFHLMLEKGFIEEVNQLYSRPHLTLNHPSMRCVGYRQAWQYLDEEYEYDVMVTRAIVATRQLAKRQMTWLRSMESITRLAYDDEHLVDKVLEQVASQQ